MKEYIQNNKETLKLGLLTLVINILVSYVLSFVSLIFLLIAPILSFVSIIITGLFGFVISYAIAKYVFTRSFKINWVSTFIVALVVNVVIALIGTIFTILSSVLSFIAPIICVLILENKSN